MNEYENCSECKGAIVCDKTDASVAELAEMKSYGRLIHSNLYFFSLIRFTEKCFSRYATNLNVFDLTADHVVQEYEFTYPCATHASDILSYSLFYYVRMRMRQFCYQENLKVKKNSAVKRKMAKLENDSKIYYDYLFLIKFSGFDTGDYFLQMNENISYFTQKSSN